MKDLKSIVTTFQNEPNELLHLLCKNIKDQTLEEISKADYGHNAVTYLKELKKIKQNKEIHKMNFDAALSEAVELTRWRKPVQTKDNRFTEIQKQNLAIVFSCTILLSVPYEWYHNRDGENGTIIQLIQSAESLNNVLAETLKKTSQLLAWRITENSTYLNEVPFFILGLILTLLKSGDYTEVQIVDLIEEFMQVEQKAHKEFSKWASPKSSHFLFRNTIYNIKQEEWLSYQPFLITQIDEMKSETLRAKLEQLAKLLA